MKTTLNNAPLLFNRVNKISGSFDPCYLFIEQSTWSEDEKLFESYQRLASTSVHEKIHWLQFAGTSWGHLALASRFAQTQMLTDAFLELGMNNIIVKFKQMKVNNESYFLEIDNFSPLDLNYYGLYDSLISHQIGFNVLIGNIEKLSKVKDLGSKLAKTILDSYVFDNSFVEGLKINYKEIKAVFKNKFSETESLFDFASFTIKDVMEGQARASEYIYFVLRGHFLKNDLEKNYPKYFKDQSYWKAFGHYRFLIGESFDYEFAAGDDLLISLSKFCIIADIALNPKTTFNASLQDFLSQKNDDFFPVSRFVKACLASKGYGGELSLFDEDSHKEFYNFICKKCGFVTPQELNQKFIEKYESFVYEFQYKWEDKDFQISKIPLLKYYHYIFRKHAELREEKPMYFFNLGLLHSGPFYGFPLNIKFRYDYPYYSCPFFIYGKNREMTNENLRPSNFYWLLGEVIKPELIRSVLLGVNDFSNYFPFDIPLPMKDAIKEMCKIEFKVEIKI